jgi:hypothetical protein
MESLSMNRMVFGLVLALACVPLSACNQQQSKKAEAVHERERGAEQEKQGGAGNAGNDFGRKGGRGLRRACASDLQQYCASAERGRARRECLESHLSQLSADCKAAVEARGHGRRRRDDL